MGDESQVMTHRPRSRWSHATSVAEAGQSRRSAMHVRRSGSGHPPVRSSESSSRE